MSKKNRRSWQKKAVVAQQNPIVGPVPAPPVEENSPISAATLSGERCLEVNAELRQALAQPLTACQKKGPRRMLPMRNSPRVPAQMLAAPVLPAWQAQARQIAVMNWLAVRAPSPGLQR